MATNDEVAEVAEWGVEVDRVAEGIGYRFPRSETRRRVGAYLRGLYAPVKRKNSWQLAEQIGDRDPYGVQYLLGRSRWSPDEVRNDLRDYVLEKLGEPGGVLILDETGFLKKGNHSAGVSRQYTGTAGRIENAQVGVFLAYASTRGAAFIDRALYIPKSWVNEPERLKKAGISEDYRFMTKPQLGLKMLREALTDDLPASWVTGDEVYGGDGRLRRWLEEERHPYVLAVRANQYVFKGFCQHRIGPLVEGLSEEEWSRIEIGKGSKGPRLYDWACIPINHDIAPDWQRWLLVRRNIEKPGELAYYIAAGPATSGTQLLAQVAGTRWAIEGAFEAAKQEVGLADYEVRSMTGWYRHITLSLLAHAILVVLRHATALSKPQKNEGPDVQPHCNFCSGNSPPPDSAPLAPHT